jgi:hypothetical protein
MHSLFSGTYDAGLRYEAANDDGGWPVLLQKSVFAQVNPSLT